MSHATPQLAQLTLVKRRRALASTAAAALSLAGCNMLGQPAAPPRTPEQIEAERKVKAYQSDIENALDKVDRERLRAAAEHKNGSAAAPAAPTATAPFQVILASSGGTETLHVPEPVPMPPAPSPAVTPTGASVTPVAPPSVSVTPIIATAAPLSSAPASATPAPVSPSPAPSTAMRATPTSPISSAPVQPLNVPTSMGVVVAPLSGDASVPSSIISPFTPPSTPTASAMGAMTAMVNSAQMTASDPPVAPLPAFPAAAAETSLDQAMDVLRKNVDAHPTLNTALALALLDDSHGTDVLKKLPDADQKVLSDLLAALEVMKSKPLAPTLAERAAPLLDATRHWQEDADLALPRLVLATRVDSFGVFTPVAGTFEQGKRHTVIIYCEVANFASKKGDDGWFTTRLAQQETLFTEDGLLVWRPNAEDVEDRSLNQRHDFYLVKKLTIPETLAAGKYTLRMSVTDRNTNKIKIVEMPIEVVLK